MEASRGIADRRVAERTARPRERRHRPTKSGADTSPLRGRANISAATKAMMHVSCDGRAAS
jgi:hypothetical protein